MYRKTDEKYGGRGEGRAGEAIGLLHMRREKPRNSLQMPRTDGNEQGKYR